MEKLILGYCILLLLIILLILGLLFWDVEKIDEKSVAVKQNLLLACSSLIAFILVHMNCLMLVSWSTDPDKTISAVTTILALSVLCAVPAVYLLKNLFEFLTRQKHANRDFFDSGK